MANDVAFAWEALSPALADGLEDLIAFHFVEVGEEAPDPDWPKYLMLEKAGVYRAVSARAGGRLVGYAAYFVQPTLHRKTSLWAVNDALYLDPEHRKGLLALQLLEAAEERLKDLGVQVVTQGDMKGANSTLAKPRATLGDLLLRRGYVLSEHVYRKRL